MKQLIRFEDTYGMTDIVCIAHDIGLQNISNIQSLCTTTQSDVFMQFGLSIGLVFEYSNNLESIIKRNNIDQIIYVFDVDAISGKGILTRKELSDKINNSISKIDNSVDIKFAPVVWSAETVALYTLLVIYDKVTHKKCKDITEIVHAKNTAKFNKKLIEEILIHDNKNNVKAKHERDYIGSKKHILWKLRLFIKNYPNNINYNVLNWIATGDASFLFDKQNILQHIDRIEQYHNKHLPLAGEYFNCFNNTLSLEKKCW